MTVRRILPLLLVFALGVGAATLTACGQRTNEAMIPAANAETLRNDLDAVLAAIDGEDCEASEKAIAQVEADLLELPPGTSKRLEQRLTEALARLKEQAAKECRAATTATTPTVTTTTAPTTTTTAPPPVTTTTAPPPTTTTPPPTTPPADTTGEPTGTVPTEDTGGVVTP